MNRETLFARLRALAAMTVANGCTEAEALVAAAKLAQLLAEHNVTLDEAQMRASPFAKHEDMVMDSEVGARLWKVAAGISILTETRWWTSPPGVRPIEIGFFGFDHEVAVAKYLLGVCAGAMSRAERDLNASMALLRPARRALKIRPYLDGMADRLGDRIAAMKPPAPTGRSLVVLRSQLITEALAGAGIDIKTPKVVGSRDNDDAYRHGRRAADQVALNRGVASAANAVRLGSAR